MVELTTAGSRTPEVARRKPTQPADANSDQRQSSPVPGKRRLEFMPRDKRRLYFLLALLVFSVVLLAVAFVGMAIGSDEILGFVVVFSAGLIGAVLPISPVTGALAAAIFAGLGVNPVLAAVAAGMAEPIGALPYYTGGIGINTATTRAKGYSRFEGSMKRRTGITLFLACVVPGPWAKIAYVVSGSARYRFWKFLVLCEAGTTIKALMYALAGDWVSSLLS